MGPCKYSMNILEEEEDISLKLLDWLCRSGEIQFLPDNELYNSYELVAVACLVAGDVLFALEIITIKLQLDGCGSEVLETCNL